MVDYLPFEITDADTIERIWNNPCLLDVEDINRKNSIKPCTKRKLSHKNLKFEFTENLEGNLIRLVVRGSFHTYFNDGKHNANKFSFNDFVATVRNFSELFQVDPSKCRLRPLEYGINIELTPDLFSGKHLGTADLIPYFFCQERNMYSNPIAHIRTSKTSWSKHGDYRFKVYGKSDEQPLFTENKQILRLEMAFRRNRAISKFGITHLNHLLNRKNHEILAELHLTHLNRMVIFDPTIKIPKNRRDQKKILQYGNPLFWENLIRECKTGEAYRSKYHYATSKLKTISEKYGSSIHVNLMNKIRRKYSENIGIDI